MGSGCQPQHSLFSNSNSNSHSNSRLYDCKVWTNLNSEHFIYPESIECPEFNQKCDVGVALSGGGFRAATCALGTLRGLYLLNLLTSKIKYLSSNSGSGWVVGPLCYFSGDISTFLGSYLPPDQCYRANLKQCDPENHSYAICRSKFIPTMLKEFSDGIIRRNQADYRGFWSQAVGKIFFKKYGLNFYDYLPVVSSHQKQDLNQRTGHPIAKMLPCDLNRVPFPITNGSI